MKKTKTIIIVIILLLAFTVGAFAESDIRVHPSDRMDYSISFLGRHVSYEFKDMDFNLYQAYYLFKAVGGQALKTYLLTTLYHVKDKKQVFEYLVKKAVKLFNKFIATSEQNRINVSRAIKTALKQKGLNKQYVIDLQIIIPADYEVFNMNVNQSDKMTFEFNIFGVLVKFHFKNTTYHRYDVAFLFQAAGPKVLNTFMKTIPTIMNFNRSLRRKLVKRTVAYFNEFIAASEENRKAIAKALADDKKLRIYVKQLEIKVKKEHIARQRKAIGNRKLALIGLQGGGVYAGLIQFSYGGRFIYFAEDPLLKVNYGFSLSINYDTCSSNDKVHNYLVSMKYLNVNACFAMKFFGYMHNLYVGIGPVFEFHLSSSKTPVSFEFNKFVFGGMLELGYMFIDKSLTFSFMISLLIKATTNRFNFFYKSSTEDVEDGNLWFGLNFSIFFNAG